MYIATYSIDIVALLCLIGFLYSNTALDSKRKKPFLAGIILTIFIILSEAGTLYTEGSTHLRNINIFLNVMGFSLTPIIPIVITLIFNRRIFTTHRLWLIPTLINIIAAVLSPLFGFIFYVDSNNQYMRGESFFIFIIVYVFNFLFLIINTLKMGKKYNYPIVGKMLVLSLFTLAGTSIQLVYPPALSSWHCVTLTLFLYLIVLSDFDSSFDTLTGLYNRATFDKAIKDIVKPKALSIIILDINDFKYVNDTYGHDYGDKVIRTVAAVVRESFNKHYKCYRYGGDEISIISNEIDTERIESYLSGMTNALAKIRDKGEPIPTVSYGYSIFTGDEPFDLDKIFKEADNQMYYFKRIHKSNAASKEEEQISIF